MLAEQRGGLDRGRGAVEAHRKGRHPQGPGGVLHGLDDAALDKARLGKQIAGVEHRAGRNAGGADQPHRFVLVVAQRPVGHHRVDLGFVPGARLARRKARVVDQVLPARLLRSRRRQCSGLAWLVNR